MTASIRECSTLYLDGELKTIGTVSSYSNATQCICLLAAYCKTLKLKVCLVQMQQHLEDKDVNENINIKFQPDQGFKLPVQSFEDVDVIHLKEVPSQIKHCTLPAFLSQNKQLIVCGLCHILRIIVKDPSISCDATLTSLLGHKKFCLKAASEVSSRTNLCEVAGPIIIDEYMYHTKPGDIRKLPKAIVLFENLLQKPVAIHNRDKRQRVVLERLSEARETSDGERFEPERKTAKLERTLTKQKEVVRTNDLPPLEHVFAEGVELTITDLALFPFVHAFLYFHSQVLESLYQQIPLLISWYDRVTHIPEIISALHLCDVTIVNVRQLGVLIEASNSEGKKEILKLGKQKKKSMSNQRKKKDLDKTLRRDLPSLLRKVDSKVTVNFQQFQSGDITIPWNEFPSDVHPVKGQLSSRRASRKCHQIENIIFAIKSVVREGNVIVDFCAGGGHVGIAMAYILPKCSVVIVDNKEESLERALVRINSLNLSNVTVYQCNLQNYRGFFDVGVALHACGVATDLVLKKCLDAHASFVISPCCYGKIRNTDTLSYPQSKRYHETNISNEEFILLGHGADHTSWDFDGDIPKQGKHCMGLVDADRAYLAEEEGYRTSLFTMQPHSCSPKNNLIVGIAYEVGSP